MVTGMGIWAKAECKLGRHRGQWSHPGGHCEIVRVCDACGTEERRSQHVWSRFDYLEAERCEQTRRCDRCGVTQLRTEHEWGPWYYLSDEFSSPQVHTCRRCHLSEHTAYTMR